MEVREVSIGNGTSRAPVASSSPSERAPVDLGDLNDPRTLAVLSVPPHSRVLDIGSGCGTVARALAARGCQVWGLEIDPAAKRRAEPWCDGVMLGDVETADLEALLGSENADVILFVGVLEQLRDPAAAIRKVLSFLAPSGRIILSVPRAPASARPFATAGSFSWSAGAFPDLLRRAGVRLIDEVRVVSRNEPQFVVTVVPDDGAAIDPMPTLVSTFSEHLHRVDARCRRLQERVIELEGQVESFRSEHNRLSAALEEAREWHRRSAETAAAVTEDFRRADLERRRSDEQLARATDDLASCQLERRFLRNDVMVKEAYLATLRQQALQRQQLNEEVRVLTERLSALTTEHIAAVERVEELTSTLDAEVKRGDGLAADYAGEMKRAAELALSNDHLRPQLNGAHQELHRVHVAIAATLAQPRYLLAERCNDWLRRIGFLHAALKRAWTSRHHAQ